MELKYKDDFNEACRYWDAFWEREIIDRPCVAVTSPKHGYIRKPEPPYPMLIGGDYDTAARQFDAWAATTFWGGESLPFWGVFDFGPDQFSAFLGAELLQDIKNETSWVIPFVDDWEKIRPLRLRPDNYVWKEMLKFLRVIARVSKGKWLGGMLDFHTHLDCLLAIRGGTNLLMDLIDCPDTIEKVLNDLRSIYAPMYEAVYHAGEMEERGTIGWAPFYFRGKFATIQCDAIALIGPEMCRRFAIPAIAEEASYLDHCVFHLDGIDALRHLDDILTISDIDVIQWVPGANKPGHIHWIDLFKRIQQTDKGLEIHCSVEEVKIIHKELCPEGVLYCVEASSEKEARELISWFKKNT